VSRHSGETSLTREAPSPNNASSGLGGSKSPPVAASHVITDRDSSEKGAQHDEPVFDDEQRRIRERSAEVGDTRFDLDSRTPIKDGGDLLRLR
jgi:hypothetical protein